MINRKSNRRFWNKDGAALPIVLVFTMIMSIGVAAFLKYTTFELSSTTRQNDSVRAFYYAEGGLQYGLHQLIRGWSLSSFTDPFYFIDHESMTTMPYKGKMMEGMPEEGYYDVRVIEVSTPYADGRDITLRSIGMYHDEVRTIVATYRLELEPSRVFDYLYFMNHWGWMEGATDNFEINGNVRANGYFSFMFSSNVINGHPEYERVNGLRSYKDSGGIYSTFDIFGTSTLKGMAHLEQNQHLNEDANGNGVLDDGEDHNQDGMLTMPIAVPMPNIGDLTKYENHARSWNDGAGSSIKIQGAGPGGSDLIVSDGVYGDSPLEKGNLLLWGTDENPIVLDGPVIVRGGLIIKGKVTGKGVIYTEENIYIPDNLTYVNPPTTKPDWDYYDYATPEERDAAWQAAREVWKLENQDADGMGLLTKENIIIADFKNHQWIGEVSSWLNDASNETAERANGVDQMPNTLDEGEGDSVWQVRYYTQQDADDGLIPPGKSVGQVVPGSGEDIDGDGVMDDRININDFRLPDNIKDTNWGGWVPPEIEAQWTPAGLNWGTRLNVNGGTHMNEINAMLYTNHATVGYFGVGVEETILLGGMVSRVEAVVLGTNKGTWTHDERFTGGGEDFGFLLPRVKTNPELVSWRETSPDYLTED